MNLGRTAASLAALVVAASGAVAVGQPATAAVPRIGYYEMMTGQGVAVQTAPIIAAGATPVQISDLSPTELAGIDALAVGTGTTALTGRSTSPTWPTARPPSTTGWNSSSATGSLRTPNPILPGGGGFAIIRETLSPAAREINVLDNTTKVTNGPGGVIANGTLDGGNLSNHGYSGRRISAVGLGQDPGPHQRRRSRRHVLPVRRRVDPVLDDPAGRRPTSTNNFSSIYAPNAMATAPPACVRSPTAHPRC